MIHSKAVETTVGVFIALGLAAILVLALKVSNMNTFSSDDGYKISANFDNVGGLKVKSPVKMSGVLVGRVSAVTFDDESYRSCC